MHLPSLALGDANLTSQSRHPLVWACSLFTVFFIPYLRVLITISLSLLSPAGTTALYGEVSAMVSVPAHGWTVSLCCALLLGKREVVLYSLGHFRWAACGSRRSQRVTKLFLRFGISFCLSNKLISFCVWLKFSALWVQWDFFFCSVNHCSSLFPYITFISFLLIVFCFALSLLSPQDLEVFDKLCFPPVPAMFLSRPSCPLCLLVQDSWHLEHETWISCLPVRQVCSALLHRGFTGSLYISPELARKLSIQSILLMRLFCSKFHQRLLLVCL